MDKYDDEFKYWLAISKNISIGPGTFSEILSKNIPLSKIFTLNEASLKRLSLSEKAVNGILKCQQYDPDKILEELEKREIKVVRIIDEAYPSELKEIYDPPVLLYYKGQLNNNLKIAVIGSRRPTEYGQDVTSEIAAYLASNNICVVSGMAIGIDTVAHQTTVEQKGKTIAVLGCGLDQIYPSRNVRLAKDILETGGAIISELPIGVPPLRYNFPRRNRIISGLCAGVVITEATEKSGSLGTASNALEQNRDVFAVPGPIHNLNSQGPNNLLKMGAKIVSKPEDILEEYGIDGVSSREKPVGSNETENTILGILESQPKHIDLIIKESGLNQSTVSTTLTLLEISSKIKHIGGMVYKINY